MKKLNLFILLLISTIVIFAGCSLNSKKSMTGIYLNSTNKSHIIINDNFPIVINNAKKNNFENIKSGDIIEVTYDSISETYPGSTQVYSCKFIKRGNIDDIPKDVLNYLQELGWKFDI